jgi:hypothetical protein
LEEKGTEGAPAVVMKSEVAGIACSREREREKREREKVETGGRKVARWFKFGSLAPIGLV